jgi:hypothetical protein
VAVPHTLWDGILFDGAQHGFRSVVFQASQDAQENPSGAGAAKAELAKQAAEAPCSPAPGLFCLAPRSMTTLRKENTRYRLPPGVGLQDHRHIRDRRPLTESFVLPPTKGVHPMPHKIERKFAFGPSALNDLAQAFDAAWLELRAWGIEANTDEQVKCIKTNLAQRIMEYAAEGEHDVEHLKEFGLQGLPHLCAHRVGLQRPPS